MKDRPIFQTSEEYYNLPKAMTPLEQKQAVIDKLKDRISNLQAIIRHCDSPEFDNPRFDMVLELTKKDKTIASEIASLENQSEPEQITDDEIDRMFPINLNPHTMYEIELNNEAINKRKGAKQIRDLIQSRLSLQAKETKDELVKFAEFLLCGEIQLTDGDYYWADDENGDFPMNEKQVVDIWLKFKNSPHKTFKDYLNSK